jgi:RNA polymerase sigma factor (sigma-70 family)
MAISGFDIEIDEVTLAGAKRGDMAACEKIYRLYQAPAFTVAARVCRCRETAQEVTQEAFITAFRRMSQFRGDAPFWGWLRRVVINHAISTLRKQPKADIVEFEDYQSWDQGEQERIGMAMDLESALQTLGDVDRSIIWLHDVEGYKHQEIARLFGKTESFSKTRLARARKRLRDLMKMANKEAMANAGA